ncbi:MAG: hypothetical protein P8Z30_06030 [Acidobacteriota bacterium]
MSAVIPGPMTGVSGSTALRLWMLWVRHVPRLWLSGRLPVHQGLLDVHPQPGHFFESLGSDEELPMAFSFLFLDPSQILGGFNKNIADRKRVHGSETILVFAFGFHLPPLINGGKKFTLSSYALRALGKRR